MPLVHNDATSASRAAAVPTTQLLTSSLNALKEANETDAVIKSVGFAKTREVLTSEISERLNTVAGEISAGTRPATGKVTFKLLAANESVTPEDSRFKPEQFRSRGFDSFSTLLEQYSHQDTEKKKVFEREVLTPIQEQLEAAGFTGVQFGRDRELNSAKYWFTLSLSLNLPQS